MDYYKKNQTTDYRKKEAAFLIIATVALLILFFRLYFNLEVQFNQTEQSYRDSYSINLDNEVSSVKIKDILIAGNYISNENDAAITSNILVDKLKKNELPNLGALNKRNFLIRASFADSTGSNNLKERVQASLQALNYTKEVDQIYKHPSMVLQSLVVGNGSKSISVIVKNREKEPVGGVVVKLQKHVITAITVDSIPPSSDRLIYFALTNSDGEAIFSGLEEGGSYSVIPIKKWSEFGSYKGTTDGSLTKNLTFEFTERPHLLRIFGSFTYNQLKEDKVFTVRTPNEFKSSLLRYLILFFISWWVLHIFFIIRNKPFDQYILPLLMMLTGTCILMMYSLHDPLTDLLYGNQMVIGSIAGLIILVVLSEINIIKFFNSNKFDPLTFISLPGKRKVKSGYGYLIVGIGLAFALLLFGTGPEGSGVKINLVMGPLQFQPSEITKYLIVIFFATYFSRNAPLLADVPNIKQRIKNSIPLVLGFVFLLCMYVLLGDMGPALVLIATFIIFYSVARGDFGHLVIGILTYSIMLLIATLFIGNTTTILGLFTFFWLLLWILYSVIRKNLYESALFFNLVIAIFIFGNAMPAVIGQRLNDRNEMCANVWDNQTYGGDQVAHGIWSLASGGFTGQGIGKGHSHFMPAAHTDMVLESTGEELGWIGLLLFIACLALLLHRSLIIGRKAAHPFLFYLTAGVAVVVGLQFLFIAAGSLGIIPLTGITVPFLSFGKMSMIANLAALGLVFSVSSLTGSNLQTSEIQKTYDHTIVYASLVYTLAAIALLLVLINYQIISASKFITKPAYVVNRLGGRIASYNPRIYLLMKGLDAGNIYDRNGLLLATNNKDLIKKNYEDFVEAGVADPILNRQLKLRQQRYYPFAQHTFFWVGNYNNRLLWGNENKGFLVENRHLSDLRGFNTQPNGIDNITLIADKYKENRFLPSYKREFEIANFDYSELIPLLKDGITGRKVKKYNRVKRDITLTLDAKLQTHIQNSLHEEIRQDQKKVYWRTSVVVVNAKTGEVLTSAVYPLPEENTMKMLYEMPVSDQIDAINIAQMDGRTFTESDLGTTFSTAPGSTAKVISGLAGLMKLGHAATLKKYYIKPEEKIRKGGSDADPTGWVDMEQAIVHSSNVYFIKLINEEKLENELSQLYQTAGIEINQRSNYLFYYDDSPEKARQNHTFWQHTVYDVRRNSYGNSKLSAQMQLRSEFSYLAWGQGKFNATPLAMARITSIVANNGTFQPSKYILGSTLKLNLPESQSLNLIKPANAKFMQSYMKKQAVKLSEELGITLAAKTGTPQREIKGLGTVKDGWYMFYTYSDSLSAPISVCIRIERANSSAQARDLAKTVVIPSLKHLKYITQHND